MPYTILMSLYSSDFSLLSKEDFLPPFCKGGGSKSRRILCHALIIKKDEASRRPYRSRNKKSNQEKNLTLRHESTRKRRIRLFFFFVNRISFEILKYQILSLQDKELLYHSLLRIRQTHHQMRNYEDFQEEILSPPP